MRKVFVLVAFALLFSPGIARAQTPWDFYGPDDDYFISLDVGPTLGSVRMMRRLIREFKSYNMVDASETCVFDQQFGGGRASGHHGAGGSWDNADEDDPRCSRLVEITAAIAGLRGVVLGDLVVAYCVAAEIVEGLSPIIEAWIESATERRDTLWRLSRIRYEWCPSCDAWDFRWTLINVEMVALQTGGYIW